MKTTRTALKLGTLGATNGKHMVEIAPRRNVLTTTLRRPHMSYRTPMIRTSGIAAACPYERLFEPMAEARY